MRCSRSSKRSEPVSPLKDSNCLLNNSNHIGNPAAQRDLGSSVIGTGKGNQLEAKEPLASDQSCHCQVHIYSQGTALNHLCIRCDPPAHTVRVENQLLW